MVLKYVKQHVTFKGQFWIVFIPIPPTLLHILVRLVKLTVWLTIQVQKFCGSLHACLSYCDEWGIVAARCESHGKLLGYRYRFCVLEVPCLTCKYSAYWFRRAGAYSRQEDFRFWNGVQFLKVTVVIIVNHVSVLSFTISNQLGGFYSLGICI